jgi:hypothetical protein
MYVFCKLSGESKKLFKLQVKVMRLIWNGESVTSNRELFKTLNILPAPCMYITETVYILHTIKHKYVETKLSLIMRSELFWDITRSRVLIVYRRFGTTYRSHLQGSKVREEKKAATVT